MRHDYADAYVDDVEQAVRRMGLPFSHIKKIMLAANVAQARHSGYLALQGMKQGALKYNPLVYAWDAQEAVNIESIKAKILQIGKQYGVDPENIMEQFQNIMVAGRVKEIHEKASDVLRNYETLKQTDPKKAAAYLKANKKLIDLSKTESNLHMTEEEADDILDTAQEEYPEFFDADGPVAMWREVRDNTVQFMVDSGRYSRNQAEALMEAVAYVPFQRVMESEDPALAVDRILKGTAHNLLSGRRQHGIKGSGREVKNIFENMEQWQAHSFAIGIKNHKALQLVDAGNMYLPDGSVREVKPGTPGAIMIYRHGKKEYYKFADPLYYHAFNGVQGVTTDLIKMLAKGSSAFQNSIVRNPLFTLAQLPQDTYAAMYTSGLKNPLALPTEVVKQFYKTLRYGGSKERDVLTKRGVVGDTGFNNIDAREMDKILGITEQDSLWDKTQKVFSHISEAGDAAVRQAVYARTMKEMKGLPDAEAIATQRALDIINFRRQGASALNATARQIVPFYGAYLQAERVALRVLSGKGIAITPSKKQAYTTLATTSMQMVALGMLYAAMANQDDEFKKMSPTEKDGVLIIPGTQYKIPLRRDWTLLPHVFGMHLYNQIFAKGTEDPEAAKKAMLDAIGNALFASPVLAPNIIKTIVEVKINHDFLTGRDIEPASMKDLDTDEKYTATTSNLGKLVGKTGVMSPVNFDHLVKGILGMWGSGLLVSTDAALGKAFDFPYTEKSVNELVRAVPGAGSFVRKENGSGDVNKFYDLLNDATKATKTLKRKEEESPQVAKEYAKEHERLIDKGVNRDLQKRNQALAKIAEEERHILKRPNKEMSPAEKRERLDKLKERRKIELSNIQQVRNFVYR